MRLRLGKRISLGLLLTATAAGATAYSQQAPTPERQSELRYLLLQDCGSCHGMTLRGGLGPPLTDQALRGKPPEMLIATVLYGRPGTAMPPWRNFMSENEVRWLVENLLDGRFADAAEGAAQ